MDAPGPERRAPLRAGLAQIAPKKADVGSNIERIRGLVADHASDVDVLVLPEASLSGYFVEGGVEEVAVGVDELVDGLGPPPEGGGPDVILGAYERLRGTIRNSAFHLEPARDRYRPVHVHRKVFLPTYALFDEARFVSPGGEFRSYASRFGPMGLLVCEDLWHAPAAAALALGGAQVIWVLSAAPIRGLVPGSARSRSVDRWEALAASTAGEHGVFVGLANLVGSEAGRLLAGGSVVASPSGRILRRAPLHGEGVTRVALDGEAVGRARARSSLLADLRSALPAVVASLEAAGRGRGEGRCVEASGPAEPPGGRVLAGADPESPATGAPEPGDLEPLAIAPERVEEALTVFIREEVEARGFAAAVVGVSGGLDSAVVVSLAARALGPENVHGLRLPYSITSEESLAHAAAMLDETGVPGETISIAGAVDGYAGALPDGLSPERRANVQARIRSMVLFDQAARRDALPLGTGNKSERLLGYFTWHGDDAPPLHPIGDLFKVQVRALARHLGIPREIVEKTPTAELIEGVTDEDELGVSYDDADLILHWLLEGYRPGVLVELGFDAGDVRRVVERLDGSHWKRNRPTVAVLSDSAVGESYLRPADYPGSAG